MESGIIIFNFAGSEYNGIPGAEQVPETGRHVLYLEQNKCPRQGGTYSHIPGAEQVPETGRHVLYVEQNKFPRQRGTYP